jgi:hypothetical protein
MIGEAFVLRSVGFNMIANRSMKLVVGDMAMLTCQWRDVCFCRSFLKVGISLYCGLVWCVMVDGIRWLVLKHVQM